MSEDIDKKESEIIRDSQEEDIQDIKIENESDDTTESEEVVEESVEDKLKASIASLESNLTEEKTVRLKAYADLDNYRKRKDQEIQSFKKYSAEKVVKELLPILDNIELALSKTETSDSTVDLLEGFKLIQKQFQSSLEKLDVKKIDADGQAFDPNYHQAMSQEESDDHESGVVIRVMQEGYLLHDRVIRPSLVVVSS